MESNIVADVSQGKESFRRIQEDIQEEVNKAIPLVSERLRKAGKDLEATSRNMTAIIDRIIDAIDDKPSAYLHVAKRHIDQYAPYR